jgi:hypothetical protein
MTRRSERPRDYLCCLKGTLVETLDDMRITDLSDRLKKNGMISVQNPVEEAMRSGKFEEIE